MGYSTQEISKVKAQTIISACGREITEASRIEYFDKLPELRRLSLADYPNQALWQEIEKCELGDNHYLYLKLENRDFIAVKLN
jgi:hypothetical protein